MLIKRPFLAPLLLLLVASFVADAEESSSDLCDYSENQFVDLVGQASLGSAITATIAQESLLMVIADGFILAGVAPAVSPAIALTVGTTAAAYGTLKAYCERNVISDVTTTWYVSSVDLASTGIEEAVDSYQSAVNTTSDSMDKVGEAHRKAVDATSTVIETSASTLKSSRQSLSDYLCYLDKACQ